jgi:hypothetical protein
MFDFILALGIFAFAIGSCEGHIAQFRNWVFTIFGMWMHYLENYTPTKIHTNPDHHLEEIAC